MARTFVLGIGAQKAGTSWLHALLSRQAGFAAGLEKEYHVWDARELPLLAINRRRWGDQTAAGGRALALMQKFPWFYFRHFDRLLAQDGSLAADITPSYAALDGRTYARIRTGMVRRNIRFRSVFIMRDPVSRCLSAFNMNRNRGAGGMAEAVDPGAEADSAFRAYVASDHARIRTCYERTLAAVEAHLPADEHLTLIYEEMFGPETIARLSDFLGLPLDSEFARDRVFGTDYATDVSIEAQRSCRDLYAPTYDYVAERFPQVRALWQGFADQG
ncbi:sulfotransferase domain-containing protein [Frigidibacter sp. RF13]|uniref:sulfotransferase domain-containing protein n=1 Tax=Frigidibacter sp. RF13 TaxID=2997340 RepID=UPI002271EEB1|nr:sulfotransferase domain-containing protein [Frigidibacter sp. RF13]MCY1127939.1 sulfotransferase domain-containing protein [Frigidibacter sp. RF13]